MHSLAHILWGTCKHLSAGYLVFSVLRRISGDPPTATATAAVLFGSLAPDLLDKPLVALGVLSYGRSMFHSLLAMGAVVGLVAVVGRTRGRTAVLYPFALGYGSHLAVDYADEVLGTYWGADTAFLLWPVLVDYPLPVAVPLLPVDDGTLFGAGMLVALALWVSDGLVGLTDAVRYLRNRYDIG